MGLNYATYAIDDGRRCFSSRLFGGAKGPVDLTEEEKEAERVILDAFVTPEYAGKVGNSIDPFRLHFFEDGRGYHIKDDAPQEAKDSYDEFYRTIEEPIGLLF